MKSILVISVLTMAFMETLSQTPKKSETVTLDGVDMYYEVYGKGEPLLLLHGFTQSSKSWLPFVADYEKEFEVYLVDLRGHGKSSWFKETISLRGVARELDALTRHLNLSPIKAIGFSYGGEVLFQLALEHPGLIESMVIIGSCGSWQAKDFPEFVDYLSYKNIDNLSWMREQQTSEDQIKSILAQTPNYNVTVSDEQLRSIQSSMLLVSGDGDVATPIECLAHAKALLPNSFLWVVPNTAHGAHQGDHKGEFVRISKDFLTGRWSK